MGNKIELHRVLKAPVSRVFRAFSEPNALAYWLSPFGFLATVHSMDFKVGGSFKISFTNFTNNKSHAFGGKYLEIKHDELLRYIDVFDDANLSGEILVTVKFTKVICGTELRIIQENIPDVIPTEMCHLGWQESFIQLAQLVEPEINQ